MTETTGEYVVDAATVRQLLGIKADEAETDQIDAEETEPEEGESDGRTLRRTRNRQRVIIALLELLRAGDMDPSVGDIADRAAVSHRSVFRYFDDVNDLVRRAIEHEVMAAAPLAHIPELGLGTLDRRIDSWVDSRLRLHAATYQVGRVARFRATEIPSIDESLQAIHELTVVRFRKHFTAELDALGPEGGLVVDTALVLTSFEAYDLQRRIMEHGAERIRQVWNLGMSGMFASVREN